MGGTDYESLPGFPQADLLLTRDDVSQGLNQLAAELQPWIHRNDCLLLGVMNGALFALAHLADRLHGDFLMDYCHVTRYRGETSGGELHWFRKPSLSLEGLTVVIIDDIWDEGLTLQAVTEYCRGAGAEQVLTAVLFIKERARSEQVTPPDMHAGLTVPDRYVFGCGMDLHDRWRHIPAVYALTETRGDSE